MESIKDPATGRLYKQEIVLCGKERCKKCARGEGHGPYWYAYWWEAGKTRKKYIGKDLPASLIEGLHKTDTLTQDSEESYVRKDKSLPKTPLHKTDDLHKTHKKALPKTNEGAVTKALEAIRSFHSRGIEPTVTQVAEVVGMEPRSFGKLMTAKAGIRAVNCRRDGKAARRYIIK